MFSKAYKKQKKKHSLQFFCNYFQKHKERFRKEARKKDQILSEEEKNKRRKKAGES